MNEPANPLTTAVESAPAFEISVDMAKRAIWFLPLAFAVGGAWGINGVFSAAYAAVLIVINFLLAAYMLSAAGKISFALMAGAALGGYLLRLGLIAGAVLLVRNQSWVEFVPLGIMLIITHLGLLLWELRFVSGSMAFPGLKPKPIENQPVDPHVAEAA